MKRFIRYVFEFIGVTIVLLILGLGTLMWRLDQGPWVLASAIPEIEAALSDMSPGLDFKIGGAQLETNKYYRAIRLRMKAVTVLNANGTPVGSLREVMFSYNWRNILRLTAVPAAVRIYEPSVDITRFANGSVGFNLDDKDDSSTESSASIDEISTIMQKMPSILRHIRITNAEINYLDEQDDSAIEARNGLFDFHRFGRNLTGTIAVDIKAKGFEQRLQGDISNDPDTHRNRIVIGMKDFMLAKLRGLTARIPPELHVPTPVNILLAADLSSQLELLGADFTVTGEKGSFTYAPYFAKDVPFKELLVNLHYAPREKAFMLRSLFAKLGDAQLLAKGSLSFDKDVKGFEKSPATLRLQAVTENVPVDKLSKYWPDTVGQNARDWVTTRIRDGIANSASVDLELLFPPQGENAEPDVKKLSGKMAFNGLTVDYLPPMQPVEGLDGTIAFDATNFDITATTGHLLETRLTSGFVRIDGLTGADQNISVDLKTEGPVRDAITLISSKPLEYAQKMGMSPQQFSGNAAVELSLRFPLLSDVSMGQIAMNAKAMLKELTVQHVVKDLNVSAKEIALSVDEKHLELAGDVMLQGSPVTVEWQEFFSAESSEDATRLTLKGQMTPATIKGLRLPVERYFTGVADADVTLTQDHARNLQVDINADLKRAGISVPPLKLNKSPGVAGTMAMKISNDKNNILTISDASMSWSGFNLAQGMARFNASQELQSATLKNMRIGRSKADIIVTPSGSSASQVVVRGDILDFSEMWTETRSQTSKAAVPHRYDVSLRANKLFLDPDIPFENVRADIAIRGNDLITAQIDAQTDQKGVLAVRQVQQKDGGRNLQMRADNTGRVLQALDLSDGVYGGLLQVKGSSTPQRPQVLMGNAVLRDFTMIKAPIMARLLNAFSPAGLLGLLNSKGLRFEKLQTEFTLPDAKTVKLKNGKMAGDSLGLSFRGTVYRDTGNLNLRGTIVPLEGINKFFGKIPLLGQILTGFNGEGIIGATYAIKGNSDDPQVSVNPLSALTPGIFRSILFESNN